MKEGRIRIEATKKRGKLKIVIKDYPKDKSEWMLSVDYIVIKTNNIRTRYWILEKDLPLWRRTLTQQKYTIAEPNEAQS